MVSSPNQINRITENVCNAFRMLLSWHKVQCVPLQMKLKDLSYKGSDAQRSISVRLFSAEMSAWTLSLLKGQNKQTVLRQSY